MSYGLRMVGSRPVELCDECGFDAREVNLLVPEIVNALMTLEQQRHRRLFDERPDEGVFSGAEYAAHAVDIANVLISLCETALGAATSAPAEDLPYAAARVEALAASLSGHDWDVPVDLGDGVVVPLSAVLTHLLHDVTHHLWDVRRGIARIVLRREPEVFTVRR